MSSQPRNHLFHAEMDGGSTPVAMVTAVSPGAMTAPRVTGRLVPESIRSQMPTEGRPLSVLYTSGRPRAWPNSWYKAAAMEPS